MLFDSDVVIIHVGNKTEEKALALQELLIKSGLDESRTGTVWQEGDPADEILSACKKENVDLLIAGAIKKENLVNYYLGSVARKILRKASCSVLMLVNPSTAPTPFRQVVISAEAVKNVDYVITEGCALSGLLQCRQIHITREIKLYGLAMSVSSELSEEEASDVRRQLVGNEIEFVEDILKRQDIHGQKINIKVLSGKSGFELLQFVKKVHGDLLVVGSPPQKFWFFDRVFTHDMEYLFQDLPSNLLIINKK